MNRPIYKIIKNKKNLFFNHYTVRECGTNFYGVYDRYGALITHRTTFKGASKIAKLLEEAYIEGCNSNW